MWVFLVLDINSFLWPTALERVKIRNWPKAQSIYYIITYGEGSSSSHKAFGSLANIVDNYLIQFFMRLLQRRGKGLDI